MRRTIVEETLRLVQRRGVQGATTARIAAASRLSEGTIYRLFGSKNGLLLAVLDLIYDRIFEVIGSSRNEDPIERLREIGRFHAKAMVSADPNYFVQPLFEFIGAPERGELQQALGERQQRAIDSLSAIVEEGKTRGSIPNTVDSVQVAWELLAIYWAEDVSVLMGLPEFVLQGRSERVLGALLSRVSEGRVG